MKTSSYMVRAGISVSVLATTLILLWGCRSKSSDELDDRIKITSEELAPDDFFQEALRTFAAREYKESAKFILQGAKAMEEIARLSDSKRADNIRESIAELNDLASSVAVDKVDGIDELNYFFSHAGEALAGMHMHVTETYYFNLQGRDAGWELQKAVRQIERLARYHNREFNATERKQLDETNALSKRLRLGDPVGKEELEMTLGQLAETMTRWKGELTVKYSAIRDERKRVIHSK